jgi:hypothetical protein
MPEQTKESNEAVVDPKYVLVKVLTRDFDDYNVLSPVRVVCGLQCDAPILGSDLNSEVDPVELTKALFPEALPKPQEYLVQINSLRKLYNYHLGESWNRDQESDFFILKHRETTDMDDNFGSMRLYYDQPLSSRGAPDAGDGSRRPKKPKKSAQPAVQPAMIPDCASLRTVIWEEKDLVVFRHPENREMCLGFVGGKVKNPYLRKKSDDRKHDDIVVIVLQFLEDKDMDVSLFRSVVFESTIAAPACLLKVCETRFI